MPPRCSKRTSGETGQHGSQPALRSQRSSRGRGAVQRGRGGAQPRGRGAQQRASPPPTDSVLSVQLRSNGLLFRGEQIALSRNTIFRL